MLHEAPARCGPMAVQATLRLRHRGCVTESFHGPVSLTQISGERGADLFVLHAPDARALAKALGDCEAYAGNRADIVSRSPTSAVFRGINPPAGAVAAIRGSSCTILWPLVYRDGLEHYTLLAPHREALREAMAALGAMGEVGLDRVSDVTPEGLSSAVPLADLTAGLTARQLRVLVAAVEHGFYDTPRRTTTKALAEAFGVSPSTLKEHLRKAEQAVMVRFATLLGQHPALAKGAARRPGRPRARP